MYYVYVIRSQSDPNRVYAGYTVDVQQRLETHNSGGSIYTANYRPWKLLGYISFDDMEKAKSFEKYLKTSSGRSFITKRFL
jgi:putative endonuclease